MSYLFAIPTIMTRPELEISNVEEIANNFSNSKVVFVSNVEDADFSNYYPKKPNIIKKVSGVKFSISHALNTAIQELTDEEYFVFVQSDVTFDPFCLEIFKQIYETDPKAGVIGIRGHSITAHYKIPVNLLQGVDIKKVLWSDGIMFFKTSIFKEIGLFDEQYLGDRESQDFCYRVHEAGYNNYNVNVEYKHSSLPFSSKVKIDTIEFKNVVEQSKVRFFNKWGTWERKQIQSLKE